MSNKHDDFFTLIKKSPEDNKISSKKDEKEKKAAKPKFKKGSWKHWLYKKAKNWKSPRQIEDFHFTKLDNLVVYRLDKPKAIISSKRFDLKKLRELQKKHDDLYVLVNATDRMFMKMSLKAYLKLMNVDKIVFNVKLQALYDGADEDELDDIFEIDKMVDSINELAYFINYHRRGADGIYEIQAMVCSYTLFYYTFRILVYKRDGSADTYKSMESFLKDYNLYQF